MFIRKGIACMVCGLLLLWSTASLAECASNKVAVTLVNPAGKIIELCLPDNAISGIEQGASNTGTQTILGHCPCFTQEEVEAVDGLVCQDIGEIKCSSNVGDYGAFACDTDVQICFREPYCESPSTGYINPPDITFEEQTACVEILEPLAVDNP